MSFIELLDICQKILESLSVSSSDVLSIFTSSLGEGILAELEFFFEFPLIGPSLRSLATSLLTPLSDVTLLNFMFGALIPVMIIYSFVKWLVGIVTGS